MRWNGNECKKAKVMRITKEQSPVQIIIDQKQLENVEYLSYLCGVITNGAICTREIESRISMTKAALNRKKTFFTSKFNLNFR